MNLNNLSVCKCWALVLADICQAAVFLLLRMHCEGDPTEGARVYVRGGGGVASLCCEPTRRADRCWEWRRGGRRCGEQRGPQMLQCFVPHLERRNTGRTNHPLDGRTRPSGSSPPCFGASRLRSALEALMVRPGQSVPPSGALLRARGPIYPARLALAQGLRLSVRPSPLPSAARPPARNARLS